MNSYRIQFDEIAWEEPAPGVKQKVVVSDGHRLRLLRFEDNFVEADWCTKGHMGYVLAGEMTIDFAGDLITYHPGDGLWIPPGEQSRHKAMIAKGKFVELLLFEEVE